MSGSGESTEQCWGIPLGALGKAREAEAWWGLTPRKV